jgi:hypothetical protein
MNSITAAVRCPGFEGKHDGVRRLRVRGVHWFGAHDTLIGNGVASSACASVRGASRSCLNFELG